MGKMTGTPVRYTRVYAFSHVIYKKNGLPDLFAPSTTKRSSRHDHDHHHHHHHHHPLSITPSRTEQRRPLSIQNTRFSFFTAPRHVISRHITLHHVTTPTRRSPPSGIPFAAEALLSPFPPPRKQRQQTHPRYCCYYYHHYRRHRCCCCSSCLPGVSGPVAVGSRERPKDARSSAGAPAASMRLDAISFDCRRQKQYSSIW